MHLTQALHRARQINGRGVATLCDGRERTWSETVERVARLAGGLALLGVGQGDRVAILSLNSDYFLEAYYALFWLGAIAVPANTRWAAAEHDHAFRDAEVVATLVDDTFHELVNGPLQRVAGRIIRLGRAEDAPIGAESLISVSTPIKDAEIGGDALAGIFYTGGTTGRSKGVMLAHGALAVTAMAAGTIGWQPPDVRFLHSPPMFHLADAASMIAVSYVAGAHVIVPGFTPEGVVRAVSRHGVNALVLVPTMFAMLAEYARVNAVDLSGVKRVTYGASSISEPLLLKAMELFPNALFMQAYGQTELSPTATTLEARYHTLSGPHAGKLKSAGRAVPGVDVKIADEEMRELPRGVVGEILVRSPGRMSGYWRQPDVTARTIVNDWVRTGDAGYMDEDGFVFVVDRVKDMIVSGGENVYSAEVENALASHHDVAECAIVAAPDETWGERVHAVVRLHADAKTSEADLDAHCRALIAGYKCPKTYEFRTAPLPVSGAGKILKTELRAALRSAP